MNDISGRILQLINEKDISYGELAKLTGIPKSALQRYAVGETVKIPLDRLECIATALNTTPAYLMGWESENVLERKLKSPTVTEDYTTFPVIGGIAAGYDKIGLEDWSGDTVDVPNTYLKGRKRDEFAVLRVDGNSMYPMYQDGDKVLILKQSTLNQSGDVGAVVYEDELITLKKIEYVEGEDWLKLIPINPEYMPKTIENEALTHCRVIGIPKLLIREL